jgi:hypothetical protein
MKQKFIYLLAATLCLLSMASHARAPLKPGLWNLHTPAGEVSELRISVLTKNEYYFNLPKHPISGVYTWDGKLLRITKPDNPRMGGYVWKVQRDRSLVLVEETPVPISGVKLVSSKIWRVRD